MQIKGQWYAKNSAAKHPALLITDAENYELFIDKELYASGLLSTLQVDPRLGNIDRKITFADGSLFTTNEHTEVEQLFYKKQKANKLLHTFESKSHLVFISFLALIGSIYIFVVFGIPSLSEKIAYALPNQTNKLLSQQTFEILDKHLFKPSQIPPARQEAIKEHFETKLLPMLPEQEYFTYHLNFRLLQDANRSLPNAMALPSGEIILTDKFVELCQSDEEIDSIILHEVGHIIHRDSLTMLVEGTFISVSVMLALGDLNGFADMGVGLGSMLLNMHYSRDHESKADHFAFEHMLQNKMDPIAFAVAMNKMERYIKTATKQDNAVETNEYISTHPQTKERIEEAKNFSECFKKGLTECL